MKDDFKEFVDNYKKDPEKSKQQKQVKFNRKKINQVKISLISDFGNGWAKLNAYLLNK